MLEIRADNTPQEAVDVLPLPLGRWATVRHLPTRVVASPRNKSWQDVQISALENSQTALATFDNAQPFSCWRDFGVCFQTASRASLSDDRQEAIRLQADNCIE